MTDTNNETNESEVLEEKHETEERSNEHFSRMPFYRYNNAYGNYRGGYDRSSQGPPRGFGPYGPSMPSPFLGYPNQQWKREFNGPPKYMQNRNKRDRTINYLVRCGLLKEQIAHLPSDLLALMTSTYCGLCAQQFDTFDLSRIHYLSKNHLKNQKKWVTSKRTMTIPKICKEPLKARELYCELCDVQITSTGHAESHYAGKSHRGIVERRRNPRNPFLLQPYMQSRVNALIRRENKYLKSSAEADKPKQNPKSVPPELYCSICKISMMCSEQMTIHLNGKKHLNKEKQHILKLMKGEVSEEDKKNTSAEAGEDVGEYDEEYEDEDGDGDGNGFGGEEEAATGDDDWGSGGEDWKPSAEDY